MFCWCSCRAARAFGDFLLRSFAQLTSLTLHSSFVSDRVAEGTARAIPLLRHLHTLVLSPGLMNPYILHPRINADLIRAIGRCRNLRNLNLVLIHYNKYLTRVRCSWTVAGAIGRLRNLEILRVHDGSIHSGYLQCLQRFIETPKWNFEPLVMKNLRELSICSLHGVEGAEPLAGVHVCLALQRLYVV